MIITVHFIFFGGEVYSNLILLTGFASAKCNKRGSVHIT